MAMSDIVEKEDGASLRAWLLVMGKTSQTGAHGGVKKSLEKLKYDTTKKGET